MSPTGRPMDHKWKQHLDNNIRLRPQDADDGERQAVDSRS